MHLHNVDWKIKDNMIHIPVPKEFNFAVNLGCLNRDKQECMFDVGTNSVTRIISHGEGNSLVQISGHENKPLRVEFLADTQPNTKEAMETIVSFIYDWFDLQRNLRPFYEIAEKDALLQPLIKPLYGLRIIGIPDLFEALCWGILGQQINLPFAYRLKREFVEAFGEAISYQDKTYWVFPDYKKIAKLSPEDMGAIKMTQRKSEYIIGIAQLMATGELTKKSLLEIQNFPQTEKALTKVRGIGPWTANYCLMRCLRYPNAYPVADVGLQNAVKFFKNMDRKPTKEELRTLAIPWEGYEAYATFYLWRGNNVWKQQS